ncbi:hypothetical protein NE237_010897 [Protea cynaroides]|uniref:Uncharacterized protein n=1 Tax=Protea cynaroides TaxID=273540 RepID=A0A9Q0L0L7_9MAGN|nr:hypothetical protein NE237_010897 [Protea cynaroides]
MVVHVGGIYSWVYCDQTSTSSSFHPISCNSTECKHGKGIGCNGRPLKACGKKSWCGVTADNGISITTTMLSKDVVALRSTYENGSRLGPLAFINRFTILHCNALPAAPVWKFFFLPPSTTSKGGIYIGAGPHIVLPAPYNHFDETEILGYAPLLANPVNTRGFSSIGDITDEYFIPLGSISVGGIAIWFNKSRLEFDKDGYGGTKISTMVLYTTLHSSIYEALIQAYVEQTTAFGIKRVASVKILRLVFARQELVKEQLDKLCLRLPFL